eukprot:CAMPEP_0178710332 /NCGR_PEP_ID=MMETSP0699-20121125/17724_1 /TAXON_ID=265572 /ORGANISM="Extubocellulus spinifer, Strain CCMP396" /LENGTH=306 /DNA_ID=CAMNT_0020358873 /DNA_START=122 /DNA_END=1042 /DNA_ORIENTATION=+
MAMMKAAYYEEFADDKSNIKVTDVPKPVPKADQALIKVEAASINPVDTYVIKGNLKDWWGSPLPCIVGYDFAGTIEAIGDGSTTDLKVGDEVFGVNWGPENHMTEPVASTFAEYVALPIEKLSKKASNVPTDVAGSIGLVGTAVGSLAIQIAKQAGWWVATTCSPRTKPYVESFGAADLIIDYTKEKWDDHPDLQGIDGVFDAIGEEDGLERAKKIVKPDGCFSTCVTHSIGTDTKKNSDTMKFAAAYVFHHDKDAQDKLMDMLSTDKLKLVVENTFPLTQQGVMDIIDAMNSRKNMGKNTLVMSK